MSNIKGDTIGKIVGCLQNNSEQVNRLEVYQEPKGVLSTASGMSSNNI